MNSQGYYTPGYNMGEPSNDMQGGPGMNNLFTDPMANAAMMYGSSLANQGKDMVNKEVRKCRICLVHQGSSKFYVHVKMDLKGWMKLTQ